MLLRINTVKEIDLLSTGLHVDYEKTNKQIRGGGIARRSSHNTSEQLVYASVCLSLCTCAEI